MDSRYNQSSTNENYGDFAGTQPTQQQGFDDESFGQQNNFGRQTSSAPQPHHHLHNDSEPIGEKQYNPNDAAAFSQPNVDELSSNQTTSYKPDVDFDQDQERSTDNTTNNEFGHEDRDESQRQPQGGVQARLTGKVQQMTGKFTKNPLQEAAGLEKQSAAAKDDGKAEALEQRASDVRAQHAAGGARS
ncbi:hypothetical protein SCHPADRAFT_315713 [Schizopora paradoxa]|uniref:CsbD-like domain-containing protein n=1 Tax=Schizopora paradoxa TaxID=27342 RepID=A0A0H2RXZ6_9AGAM|nr:hypothetical protein SCHPADRAFT_315713 [Schizopora paradoxa]